MKRVHLPFIYGCLFVCGIAGAQTENPNVMPASVPKDRLVNMSMIAQKTQQFRLEPITQTSLGMCQKAVPLNSILLLGEVVDFALCNSPITKGAWANIRAQAANVALAKTAYLPELSVSVKKGKNNTRTTTRVHDATENQTRTYNSDHTQYVDVPAYALTTQTDYGSKTVDYAAQLSWTLIDGGYRRANLQASKYLLEAAAAASDQTIQQVFYNTVKAYYAAQTAEATYRTANDSAMLAKVAFDAANARYKQGIGTLADKLQSETAYKQGLLKASQAEGDYKIAMGTLFSTMGIQPVQEYILPTITVSATDFLPQSNSVLQMIGTALKNNPQITQAKAEVKAANANIRANRAAYAPKVGAYTNWNRDNYSNYPGSYGNNYEYRNNLLGWGLQLTASPFDALATHYRVRNAIAQRDQKEANQEQIEKSVALEVWQSYQEAEKSRNAIVLTQDLVKNARRNYEVANGRYKAGVGSILELLNAQNDLSNARQEEINNYALWKASTVRLAASMGLFDEMNKIVKPVGLEK